MLPLLVGLLPFLVPLLALLAFMLWDQRRMGRPPEKNSAKPERVRLPGDPKWKLLAGLGCVAVAMAVAAWIHPMRPPLSGRWGWLEAMVYARFGEGSMTWTWLAIGAVLFAAAFIHRR